jgi:monoamine oxidase
MIRAAMTHPADPIESVRSHKPPQPPLLCKEVALTRRDFLKGTLRAAGVMAAWGILDAPSLARFNPHEYTHQPDAGKAHPITIVGGGLGGLVTAYRLHQQGIPCQLFEGSQRLGGRVFTRSHFNPDGMFVEMGGELVDTGHEDLIALCHELNVPLERFAQQELGIEPAIFYSQGQVYTETQVFEAFQPLAKALAQDLLKCFPNGVIEMPTYQRPYQAAWMDRLSLAEYLHRQSAIAPAWILRLIESAYIGEYGLDTEEQSALNLLLLVGADSSQGFRMFGESDEAMRIRGGNSRLVDALSQALRSHVPIRYGHRLTRLALRHGQLQLGWSVGKQFRWESTPLAVLAIPFSVLRGVAGLDSLGLSPLKQRCIAEWGYGTNSKQMMGFQSRFWRTGQAEAPASSGELITDLPNQCYWETSRLQVGKSGIFTNFIGGKTGREATSDQWQHVFQDLKPLFGDLASQHDGHRAFFNWHRHPWAKGSYTCPRPGQYTTLVGAAQVPELDNRLFFAGEHCSLSSAGYMNGAVESGNKAARQISEKSSQAAIRFKQGSPATV